MSLTPSSRSRYTAKYNEICIGNISSYTEPNTLLQYFQRFGNIIHYNITSPTGGYVFIEYENPAMVDQCMASRPHYLDNQELYVKRSLPVDNEHPRERFETTRKLMVVIDFDQKLSNIQQVLMELCQYFSFYDKVHDYQYCQDENFHYVLFHFPDTDPVDRIILAKPHDYCGHQLNVMKCIPSNIELMRQKYSSNSRKPRIIQDTLNDNTHEFSHSASKLPNSDPMKKGRLNEADLEKEVFRLQNTLTKMNEDFALQRKELENDCSQQLKKLNENTEKTQRLQQKLEQDCTKLSVELQSIQDENNELNEQYLTVELENFEITSYYEQILAEEKAKTIQLELEYAEKLKKLQNDPSSSSISPLSPQSTSSNTK